MESTRASSLMLIGEDRQHRANAGYSADPVGLYGYDKVANYKNVESGDLVFSQNRLEVLGIAKI